MSRSNSPFRVSVKVSPVKHIRFTRNASLPTLQSSILSTSNNKCSEDQSLQLSQRSKRPIIPVIHSHRQSDPMISNGVQSKEKLVSQNNNFPILNLIRPNRLSKINNKNDKICLTERAEKYFVPEVYSEIPGHKPKLFEVLRNSRRDTTHMSTLERLDNQRKQRGQQTYFLPDLKESETKNKEESESGILNWDSEDDLQWIGKIINDEQDKEEDANRFWKFEKKEGQKNKILLNRSIFREESPDKIKCAKCKKCNKCSNCKKCTLIFQCNDCLKCFRCYKCDNCQEKDDLSPEKSLNMKNEFFGRFKKLEDLQRKGLLRKNPRDYYLKSCRDQRILPFPLHIYNAQENEGKRVNLRHYGIRNTRASALASSVSINDDLENIDLTSNGIQGKGIAEVVSKLTYNVKSVDLTDNKLDDVGLKAICIMINNHRYSNLVILKLEGMGINDRQGEILATGLMENNYIRILSLARNNLGNRTMIYLANYIQESSSLQQLYLHWNNILWKGCCALADSICKNDSLKVFDLSWNKISHKTNKFSVEKLSEMFQQNTSLVHVDFSFCGFREEECLELSRGLLKNQTILGIHMAGNRWMADDLGFLNRITDIETAILRDALWKRLSHNKEKLNKHAITAKATGNCWICEGWREIKFIWKNTKSEEFDPEPIYVHMGFDNWRGHLMKKQDSNTYTLYKMCPPGILKFYFSIQGTKAEICADTETIETLPETDQSHSPEQTKIPKAQTLNVKSVSLMTVEYFEPLVTETLDIAIERCVPRPKPPTPIIDNRWRWKASIFRHYRRDDDDLERKCFEFDFETSKIRKIVSKYCDDILLVKEELWKYYKRLRAAFKYYSAQSPIGEVFSMPLNPLTEFVMQTGVVDNKNLKLHAIDKNFIAVKSQGQKRHPRNPEKALIRFQFLEILVRCAGEKYIITKKTSSYVEAIQWFMEEVTKHCEEFEHNAFRLARLWNPFNDFIYQANLNLMKRIYWKYCDHTNSLKLRKNWNLADYYKFLRDIGIINVYITEREPALIFNLAMMTQVDEISSDKQSRMFFVEFLDVFARLADRITPTEDNPMPELHDKIAELMRISAKKCFSINDYHVIIPPISLKDKVIDLSY